LKREYTYTIEVHPTDPDEEGYWVSVPALPGCFSRGETYDDAIRDAREAIELHPEGLAERGEPIPFEPQQSLGFLSKSNEAAICVSSTRRRSIKRKSRCIPEMCRAGSLRRF
jgi:antitoxin HicB